MTTICKSLEYQCSDTMVIAFSFPICPAGIVWVMRVPCALTPAIVCVPRSSFFRLPFASSCCCRDSILPLSTSFNGPFIPANGLPICSAVFVSVCRMKLVPATGSLMNTNDFGCPEVANGPIAGNVISLRKRPWLSRKRFVSVFRAIWFPSARVCVDSETATALKGTPVTTFPPCIPSKPSNSMRSPIMPASGPGTCSNAIGGGGSGAASCALANPVLNMKIPPRTILIHTLRFIIPSPLLSRTVANSLLLQSRPAPSSAAQAMLQPALSELLHPPASTSPKRPLPSSVSLPEAWRARPAPPELLLRQPHRLRQSIIANEQIHKNPFAGSLLVNRQAQRAQRTALHAHAQNRGLIGIRGEGSGQEREAAQFIVSQKHLGTAGAYGAPLLYSIWNLGRSLMIRSRDGIVLRRIVRTRHGIQMVRSLFMLAVAPIAPAHRAGQHGRSGQRPRSNYGGAPHFP